MFQSLKPFNEFSQTTAVQKYANKITLPISNKKDQYDNSATLFLFGTNQRLTKVYFMNGGLK